MKKTTVTIAQQPCTVAEFLALAEAGAGASAWVLLESASWAGLVRLAECKARRLADDASRIIVFSPHGEYRMEKALFAKEGIARSVRPETTQGKECCFREQAYLLRRDAEARGSLVCREFFCPDKNGMLTLLCDCLVDVREERQ